MGPGARVRSGPPRGSGLHSERALLNEGKIEAALLEEMRRAESSGGAQGTISVLIEHAQPAGSGGSGSRVEFSELEDHARKATLSIRKRLDELGAKGPVHALTLASAIEARLTPGQIREIASHPDVKRILWNRAEKVTA